MRPGRGTTGILLTAVILGVTFWLPIHVVWDRETGTQLLASEQRGTLFVGRQRAGWSGSVAALTWQGVRNFFRAPTEIQAKHAWLTVFELTANGVKEFTIETPVVPVFVVFDDRIYGNVNGRFSRWTGRGFEAVTPADQQRFWDGKPPWDPSYSHVAGWSGRFNMLSGGEGDQLLDFGVRLTTRRPAPLQKEILVSIGGREARRIWFQDEGPRHVNVFRYRSLLSSP